MEEAESTFREQLRLYKMLPRHPQNEMFVLKKLLKFFPGNCQGQQDILAFLKAIQQDFWSTERTIPSDNHNVVQAINQGRFQNEVRDYLQRVLVLTKQPPDLKAITNHWIANRQVQIESFDKNHWKWEHNPNKISSKLLRQYRHTVDYLLPGNIITFRNQPSTQVQEEYQHVVRETKDGSNPNALQFFLQKHIPTGGQDPDADVKMCGNDFLERLVFILYLYKQITSLSPLNFAQYDSIYPLLAQNGLMIVPIFDHTFEHGHWLVSWRNPDDQRVYVADTWQKDEIVQLRRRRVQSPSTQKQLIEAYRLTPKLEDRLVTLYWNKPLMSPNKHGERKRATYYVVDVQIQKNEWVCGWYVSIIMIFLAIYNGDIHKINNLHIPRRITDQLKATAKPSIFDQKVAVTTDLEPTNLLEQMLASGQILDEDYLKKN